MLVLDQRKQLFEIFALSARPEVPLSFAFGAGRLPALLTGALPIVNVMVFNEHVASHVMAVSAFATVDLCGPGLDRLH